jgi:hypothetical protein
MPDMCDQVQTSTALVLILTNENLPECNWIVYREQGLEGWIVDTDGTEDALYALQVYAQKFGTGVRIDYAHHIGYTLGTYSGTPVRVMGKVRDHA